MFTPKLISFPEHFNEIIFVGKNIEDGTKTVKETPYTLA